jgi:hypothetical protein
MEGGGGGKKAVLTKQTGFSNATSSITQKEKGDDPSYQSKKMLGRPNIEGEYIGGVGYVMDLTKTWTIHLREKEEMNLILYRCFHYVFLFVFFFFYFFYQL